MLAYPVFECVYADRSVQGRWRFDTTGARHALTMTVRDGVAGDMIDGLFRAEALVRVGGYARAIYPDRLLLGRLAFLGTFVQADEVLWHRQMGVRSTPERQRSSLFADRPPAHSRAPWCLKYPVPMPAIDGLEARWTYLWSGIGVAPRRPQAATGRLLRAGLMWGGHVGGS